MSPLALIIYSLIKADSLFGNIYTSNAYNTTPTIQQETIKKFCFYG